MRLALLCRHELEHRHSTLAACIIEPILQGANGMRMVDPLYQRVLVEACRYADHASRYQSACVASAHRAEHLVDPWMMSAKSSGLAKSAALQSDAAVQGEGHAGDKR